MRIAVISDTHDRVPPALPGALATADEIWHLGDVCSPGVLDLFSWPGRPLRVVRGNCDACLGWPLALDFNVEGFRIRLEHIPPRHAPSDIDILLHGHTHVPRNEQVSGVRFLNPGCITRPNRGAPASFAWLELERGKPLQWKLVPTSAL